LFPAQNILLPRKPHGGPAKVDFSHRKNANGNDPWDAWRFHGGFMDFMVILWHCSV
jgi:hypothetical protein